MIYRFFLDDILIDEPIGLDKLLSTIKRDRTINGILQSQDATVTFKNSGFDYLNNLDKQFGFTKQVTSRIEKSKDEGQNWKPFHIGIISLSDIEWDEKKSHATTKIQDNSYTSRISNNKSIVVHPSATTSKNGVAISACPIGTMTWFYPLTGTTITDDASANAKVFCYKIYDLFKYLIAWASDNEVAFESSYLGVGGIYENVLITSGRSFRKSVLSAFTANTNDFVQRFPGEQIDKLLKNICKTAKLSFIIDNSTAKPTLRLEGEDYFKTSDPIMTIENINELKRTTDFTQLFSSIQFGSSQISDHDALWGSFPEYIRLVGFNQEEYYILGQTNLPDNPLDLKLEYITSSNMIENIWANRIPVNDDSNDDALFLISATSAGANTYAPTKTNWLDPASTTIYFYNELFTNNNISDRFLGGVPNTIAAALAPTNDKFRASIPSNIIVAQNVNPTTGTILIPVTGATEPIPFSDETTTPNQDIGGHWDNGILARYTIPSVGVYTFNESLKVLCNGHGSGFSTFVGFKLFINRYDNFSNPLSSTLLSQRSFVIDQTNLSHNTTPMGLSHSFNANTGDIIQLRWEFAVFGDIFLDFTFIKDSYFECTNTATGGGTYHTYDPKDIDIYRHQFEFDVTDDEWEIIKTRPRGQITFSGNGQQPRKGWIEDISMDHKKGQAKFNLSSTKRINQ